MPEPEPTITNKSYLTGLDELWQFANKRRLQELATEDPDDDPYASPMSSLAEERLLMALNWGADVINNFLRYRYDVTKAMGLVASVSAESPGQAVKIRNVQLAEFNLSRKRLPLGEQQRIWADFVKDLEKLAAADASEVLGEVRSAQILPVGTGTSEPPGLQGRVSIFDGVPGAPWADPRIVGER